MWDKMQVLDLLPSASNVITVIGLTLAVLLAVVALLYYVGLPRPIPGIPHNKAAARKFLGDAPDFVEHFQSTGEGWDWFGLQCEKMQSREYSALMAGTADTMEPLFRSSWDRGKDLLLS